MSRITMVDNAMSAMVKLAEGNPGAAHALGEIFKAEPEVDPQCAWQGLGGVFHLDEEGIYGPRIWMLFKDVCKRDAAATLAVLRAVQLGLLGSSKLHHAIDNMGEGIDVVELHAKVKDELGQFGDLGPSWQLPERTLPNGP